MIDSHLGNLRLCYREQTAEDVNTMILPQIGCLRNMVHIEHRIPADSEPPMSRLRGFCLLPYPKSAA